MSQRVRYPRATTQRTARLGQMFWALANTRGGFSELRDPEAVARHAVASIRCLQSDTGGADSQALAFLMRLEHDPHYASPEQSRGGDKTSRSLVYSIGVLLFERLTGHHPFVESFSPLQAAIMRDAAAARGTNTLCHVPARLREVLNRAMSPFPADRYADVTELCDALDQYVRRDQVKRRRARSSPPPCPNSTARHLYDARRPSSVEFARGSIATQVPDTPASAPPDPATGSAATSQESAPRVAPVLASAAVSAFVVAVALLVPGSAPATASEPEPALVVASDPHVAPAQQIRGGVAPADPDAEIDQLVDQLEEENAVMTLSVFDPDLAGGRAALAAAHCFAEERRGPARIGVTLSFAAEGLSDRVYFAPGLELFEAERACLSSALVGIDAGGPPDAPTEVTYVLRFPASGPEHKTGRVHQ